MSESNHADADLGRQAWQSQQVQAPRISAEYVRFLVERLDTTERRLRLLMVASTLFIAAVVVWTFVFKPKFPPPEPLLSLVRAGACLALLSVVYITRIVWRRRKVRQGAQDEVATEGLQAYRGELQRLRNYCFRESHWHLLFLTPGPTVLLLGGMLYDPRPGKVAFYGLIAVLFILVSLFSVWHGRREGRRYQREIEAIGTLGRS